MTTFTVTQTIHAPPAAVWAVLADIGGVADWNPGVVASARTGGTGADCGSTRHCDLGRAGYVDEEVVESEAERRIVFRITRSNLPFRRAEVAFALAPTDAGTRVSVSPTYELKYGPLGVLIDALMVRRTYRKGMRSLAAGLKRRVEAAAGRGA
jgi:uncharacterized protein YndB with AHSA1/START domain